MEVKLHFQRLASGRTDAVASDGEGGNHIGKDCRFAGVATPVSVYFYAFPELFQNTKTI